MKDPGQYDRYTYEECDQKHDDKCIDVVYGWKKKEGEEVSEIQALRYKKSIWTEESAKAHCKSRGGTFEPASEESDSANHREIYMAVKLNSKGKGHAGSLIDSGRVDKTSDWSFSAEDGNKILGDPPDWNEYGKWFLGIDDGESEDTKAHYKYPFGKNGKVYRSGLTAIRQRAGQQNETDIYDAAGALIEKIDGGKSDSNRDRHYSRSPFKARVRGDFKILNSDQEEATVYIYDEISWWGISAEQFVKELNEIKSKTIHLRLNSPGGSVFDGTAIYNALKQHKAKIITHIDGLAASICSIVAMAGDEIRMAENAFFMIHEPWSIVIGMAEDMRKEADLLDKVGTTICNVYMKKTGKIEAQIREYMAAETWFTASEAKEAGFIDVIEEDKVEKAQALNLFDLSIFANVPNRLKDQKSPPTARDLERILRDGGCSEKMAKTILSEGLSRNLRDGDSAAGKMKEKEKEPNLRDGDQTQPKPKRDKVADLLIRAERIAPSTN